MVAVTAPASAGRVVGYARLLVPAVAVVLVGFALNASWHAMQGTLRQLGAPGELVLALPVVLEPAALIYAWVTIDRRRTGRDCGRVRVLLAVAMVVAVAYNVASALPPDVLLPAGSVGRMIVLAVSAALAPLTVVSVGHTALEEYAAWRAARRSLVDDVHAALEAEAQKALTGRLHAEFAPEVHAAVLDRLRTEMTARLGTTEPAAQPEQDCPPVLCGGEQPRPLTAGSASDDGPPRAVSVLWERIAVEVAQLEARPTQQAIADRLGVSRASVQRAIAVNRDAWEQLTSAVSRNGDGPPDRGG